MSTGNVVPEGSRWIEEIRGVLQWDSRQETITLVARALLILLEARKMPDFLLVGMKVFSAFGKKHDFNPIMRAELTNIAVGFVGLDDATAACIQQGLQEILDQHAPKKSADSLRTHLAAALHATCVDRELVETGRDDPFLAGFMLFAAIKALDAPEDFVVTTTESISDRKIAEAIGAFYTGGGFTVKHDLGVVFAEKGEETLVVSYTNGSDSPSGRILVTVNH
jgi:hypothetical protein